MTEEKEGSVIYEHPQPRVLTKMAGLIGLGRPVPALPTDPVPASSGEVRVLDRKLEEEDKRLKKDNRRWRGVIYLTVAICLLIFCLVLAQVISSVTSIVKPLPNIDVSAEPNVPRSAAFMAALSAERDALTDSGPAVGSDERPDAPMETAEIELRVTEIEAEKDDELDLLEEEDAEALSGSPEARSGYVAYIPVPLGGEESKTSVPTTTTTTTTPAPPPPPPRVRQRPFFVPVMFQEQGARPPLRARPPPFVRPPASVVTPPRSPTNQRPPFAQGHPPTSLRPPSQGHARPSLVSANHVRPLQGHALRPLHPQLQAFLQRPAGLPPSFNLQQDGNVVQNTRPIGALPLDDDDPFSARMGVILRSMRQLMRTVRPLLVAESSAQLPTNVSLSRLLRPAGPFGPPRRPIHRPPPPQQRNFPPPPPGYRPGPFRPPISVTPPLQATNQRGFAPRPTNQRVFPPRPNSVHQRVFPQQVAGQQRNPPRVQLPPPRLRQNIGPQNFAGDQSRGYPTQVNRPSVPTLVGNPQYSYPNTATGIQDIIRYIHGERSQPHNGHGSYNSFSSQQPPYNPNTRYASSEISSNSQNGYNSGRNQGFSSGNRNNDGNGYSGPIYPPGYDGQRFSLGGPDRPFRLMLDVYPMEDSDRYQSSDIYVSSQGQNQFRNANQNQHNNNGNRNRYNSNGNQNQYSANDNYNHFGNNNNYNQFSSSSGNQNNFNNNNNYQHQYSSSHGNHDHFSNGNGNQNRFSDDDRHQNSDNNRHEIVLHLNLYSRRPSQHGGSGSHSGRRLSLDIPLKRNQLTPQLLYDAILGGKWRPPADEPRFEFLQEMSSTRDKVGIDLFPIEEAPKILAALESKLFERPQPVLDLGPLRLPSPEPEEEHGDKYDEDEDDERRYGGVPQASGEHPRWSVEKVNTLTEGYLRPDQVTRPPVTARPPTATPPGRHMTYEPLPTPLASRRLLLPPGDAAVADHGGEEGASVADEAGDGADFMLAEE